MLGKLILSALIVGLIAGGILAAIQHLRLTPLIAQAEVYETAADAAKPACTENMAGMKMCGDDAGEGWKPAEGFQRIASTSAASMLLGAGYGIMLAGIALVSGASLTRRNGMIYGLCGFLACALAPAMGLPPEVPGMAVADLTARQLWWLGTVASTGLGIYLIALRHEAWATFAAVALLAVPHLIGAPVAPNTPNQVPAELASRFAANSLGAAAIFWCLLGLFLGLAFERLNLQEQFHD